MKKILLSLLFILLSKTIIAQSFHAELKANGLTCAMCSYSTQRSLEKLDFIKSITPDLEATSFKLEFKEDMFIDFDLIQEKVEDAGFFVGKVDIIFDEVISAVNDKHSFIENNLFHIFSDKEIETNVFSLVDKNFISKKKFNLISEKTTHSCFLTGKHTKNCCSHHDKIKSDRVFHLKTDL